MEGNKKNVAIAISFQLRRLTRLIIQKFFILNRVNSFAVRTGLEPATPCVTGMYSNQAELPHQRSPSVFDSECKDNYIFLIAKTFAENFSTCDYFFNHWLNHRANSR